MTLDVDFKPTWKRIRRRLSRALANTPKRVNETLEKTSSWVLRESLRAFDRGAQPAGRRWAKNLNIKYRIFKKQIMGQTKPGLLTGRLRRSISQDLQPSQLQARVGSPVEYADEFTEGQKGEKKFTVKGWHFRIEGSPPRQFLPKEARVADIMQGHVNTMMRRIERSIAHGGV